MNWGNGANPSYTDADINGRRAGGPTTAQRVNVAATLSASSSMGVVAWVFTALAILIIVRLLGEYVA